jgi:hypothetical protein
LELSLAETPKNENLLIAACHFWSNGVNAFLFGHGPMSPTLADVLSHLTFRRKPSANLYACQDQVSCI